MGKYECCEEDHASKKGGCWTKEEDELLITYIHSIGTPSDWRSIPNAAGLQRCGKSCWERWTNYLKPGLKKETFTEEEDEMIISLQALHGNKWAKIAANLPGRTGNDVKNRWIACLKKLQTSSSTVGGLDPLTKQHSTTTAVSNAAATTTSSGIGSSSSYNDATTASLPIPNLSSNS